MEMQAAMPGEAPAAAGFPREYPVVKTLVNGVETILRPLKNPQYDTELILTPTTVTEVTFFQRALSQTTAAGGLVKTLAETNMRQSAQLPTPLHQQIYGFLFEVEPSISIANFNAIYTTSVFQFTFSGTRVYLQIPLQRIPTGVSISGFASTTVGATSLGGVTNGIGHIHNIYNFTVGNKALQIRPNEAFNISVAWPTAAPTLTALNFAGGAITSIRLRVYIVGLFYSAL